MVRPGGVAQPYRGVRVGPGEKLRGEPQAAAAARGLQGNPALAEAADERIAKSEPRDGVVESRRPGGADIGFAALAGEHPLLGPLDRAHDRRVALLVLVDAGTEVDLVGIGIGPEGRGQRQDRIRRECPQTFKHC